MNTPNLPKRESLVNQTAAILRQELKRGTWQEWLPGERVLCDTFQISRNTLRSALAQLHADGQVRPVHGSGNRILTRARRTSARLKSRDVGLLTPDPLQNLRPTMTLWIDELRALLSEQGCQLHVFHGRQYFRANPGAALTKLTTQYPHGCWILALSNESTQRWFEKNVARCVVAGSVHPGLRLPYRDLDHRAMCRHAAGAMLRAGHRKLAIVISKLQRAGDLESEAGFVEGVKQSLHEDAGVFVCWHDGSVPGIANAVRRMMEQGTPPTALFVANAYHYLTVVTRLAQMGFRIPEDVSVVSRDEDPFLSFVVPTPARYVANPHAMARSLVQSVQELMNGQPASNREVRIMPEFVPGESLAPPSP